MADDLIEKLKIINKDYYSISDLEKITGFERKSLLVKLTRLQKRNKLKRIRRGFYQLAEKPLILEKIITQIFPGTYISFESALAYWGILSQKPYAITLAVPKRSQKMQIAERLVELRRLKKQLFFGIELIDNAYIAKPEKALLDQLYLVSKGRARLDFDEINLKNLKKTPFLRYSKKYPEPTRKLARKIVRQFGKTSVTIK